MWLEIIIDKIAVSVFSTWSQNGPTFSICFWKRVYFEGRGLQYIRFCGTNKKFAMFGIIFNLKNKPAISVLVHDGGSCNAYTIKRSITLLCIPKQSMWQNGVFPELSLTSLSISTPLGNIPCIVQLIYVILSKSFHVAIVWNWCFIVNLFGNAPICASTVLEGSWYKIHVM
jgi:hypothetical protein